MFLHGFWRSVYLASALHSLQNWMKEKLKWDLFRTLIWAWIFHRFLIDFGGCFGVQNRSKMRLENAFETRSEIKGPKTAPRRPKASKLGPTWGPRGVLNGVEKVLKSGLKLQSLLEPQLDPNLTPTWPQISPQMDVKTDPKRASKAIQKGT